MKGSATVIHYLLGTLLIVTCCNMTTRAQAQDQKPTLNYVVIGAFSVKRNAVRFAKHVSDDLNTKVQYELNPNRNLNYVYSLSTTNLEEAMAEAKRLRDQTPLHDAWVFKGSFQNAPAVQVTEKAIRVEEEIEPAPVVEQPVETKPVVTETKEPESVAVKDEVKTKDELPPPPDAKDGKVFMVKLFRASDQKSIKGKIDVIDTDKVKKIASFESDVQSVVPKLGGTSKSVTMMVESFGYRKTQITFDYENPVSDSAAIEIDSENRVIVPLELVRLRKGDFAIMYNVFFFRDAAIMRPESHFEINNLLEMMKENEKCVIRIHGHTNGNHSGRIIYRGNDVTNFFSLDGSRNAYGSAKELSLARANEIRDYLIAEGVEPNRIQVKAWGGKKAIFDKNSPRAAENVRVEVEIVSD